MAETRFAEKGRPVVSRIAARKNKRQSNLKDFHTKMDCRQHGDAWRLIKT